MIKYNDTLSDKDFKDYKLAVAEVTTDGIKQVQLIEPNTEDYITIPLEENRETTKHRRAREKRELRKEIEEYDRL